jgi:hypothetical protein
MPSRAEIRSSIETVLRGVSLVLLAWMLWLSLDRGRTEKVVSAKSAGLEAALADWSRSGLPHDRVAVELDSTPRPAGRDWLRALRGAGSVVTWSGNLDPVAVSGRAVAAPRGGILVTAAAGGRSVSIADEVGAIDTAETGNGGAAFSIPSAIGFIEARSGGSVARGSLPDSVRVRRVLVLGTAGWESKFIVAALEESGWAVDASMYVAPGVTVVQGATSPIDTARYSAVVALDGAAASRAGEITRFVASGGGLVLGGTAASIEALGSLRAGSPGRAIASSVDESASAPTTLTSLAALPLASLRPDAVPLERRGPVVVAAARRHGGGRVLQQGYLETWRWRMSGGDESLAMHRQWWTKAVAGVAHAPRLSGTSMVPADHDPAPVAGLVDALGPPSAAAGPNLASAAGSISLWWLAAALALCLLGEWASRRLRGMK